MFPATNLVKSTGMKPCSQEFHVVFLREPASLRFGLKRLLTEHVWKFYGHQVCALALHRQTPAHFCYIFFPCNFRHEITTLLQA